MPRLLGIFLSFCLGLTAADVVIHINTSAPAPIPAGFSGFNAPQLRNAVEYFDPNFISMTARLNPGWIRFPAGAAADAYDWSTGQLNSDWVNVFSGIPQMTTLLGTSQKLTQAKGGVTLADFSTFANGLGAGTVICFNGFTDNNPSSARNMALAVQSQNLKVAAWELTNEPHLFPGLFASATAFANQMQAYYNEIISATPNAAVALPFAGLYPGYFGDYTAWDSQLASYSPRYWNAVATHIYPIIASDPTPTNAQAFLNGILAHGSTQYVDSYLLPLVGRTTPIYVTEFNCSANRSLLFQTYLYNGIFLAEYILRMSTHPNVRRIGVHGLYMGNYYQSGMIRAARDFELYLSNMIYPNSVNTSGWDFGFFMSAPGMALEVANEAINNSTHRWPTTVTGGATVPILGFDGQPVPAVHAQAYKGGNGKNYLVITNKSATTQTVAIQTNGGPLTAPLYLSYVANPDFQAANTASSPLNVQMTTAAAAGSIQLPAYCVMRVEW